MSSKTPLIALYNHGGGIRGLIPAHMMQRIEETTGLPMAHMVDIFCGPSTGSILNAAMNIRHPYEPHMPKYKARHMVRFYEREGHQIFPQDAFRSLRSFLHDINNRTFRIGELERMIRHGHYEHANLGRALRALFARTKLSESLSGLLIPVYNISGQKNLSSETSLRERLMLEGGHAEWLAHFPQSLDLKNPPAAPDVSLFDAVMGSTAAPTYFPSHQFDIADSKGQSRTVTAIDGSIFDNPAASYFGMLKRHIPQDRDLIMIVLGTGHCNRSFSHEDWNRFGAIGVVDPKHDMPLINIFFHASETALSNAMADDLKNRLYIFNKSLIYGAYSQDFPSTDIDDASPDNIHAMKNFFEMMLEENRKSFTEMCEILVQNYQRRMQEHRTAQESKPPKSMDSFSRMTQHISEGLKIARRHKKERDNPKS
jgi:uncharacterized protein